MNNLKIEVVDNKLNASINGVPIGDRVTRLTFKASTESGKLRFYLSLDGTATIEFAKDGLVMSGLAHSVEEICKTLREDPAADGNGTSVNLDMSADSRLAKAVLPRFEDVK